MPERLRHDKTQVGITVPDRSARDLLRDSSRRITLFQYSANTSAFVRVSAASAKMPLERVEKVIVCFARRVLHRVFPDPEMFAFFLHGGRDYFRASGSRIFAFNATLYRRAHNE